MFVIDVIVPATLLENVRLLVEKDVVAAEGAALDFVAEAVPVSSILENLDD